MDGLFMVCFITVYKNICFWCVHLSHSFTHPNICLFDNKEQMITIILRRYIYFVSTSLYFLNYQYFELKPIVSTTSNLQCSTLSVTLILTELFQHNLINVSYLTACYFYQVIMTLHFLNDVANDAESTQTSKITS